MNQLLEGLQLLAEAINLPSDAKTSALLLKALPDLFVKSPRKGPPQRWMGALAQIAKPFEGEFKPPEQAQEAPGEINREAA
jgi:hypothetical protein